MAMVDHFPSISQAELNDACKQLHDFWACTPSESDWLDVTYAPGILRVKQKRGPQFADGASNIESITDELNELEDCDPEALERTPSSRLADLVLNFSVVHSPTYQTPVLWLELPLQMPAQITSLDWLYNHVVSPATKQSLRQVGVLGGLSIANHPLTDLPAVFVHPCMTQEALLAARPGEHVSPIEYLLLWFGIIPSALGLTIPTQVMARCHSGLQAYSGL